MPWGRYDDERENPYICDAMWRDVIDIAMLQKLGGGDAGGIRLHLG